MNKATYIFLALIVFSTTIASAQCGTDLRAQAQYKNQISEGGHFSDIIESQRDFEFEEITGLKTKKAIRTIPVVFHVVHTYGPENISKEQIEDQIRILNEDFQRLNKDTSSTRSIFKDRASSFDIEFKLARVAPDGSCTEGITRHYSELTNEPHGFDGSKVVGIWDYTKYLNIWVVNSIDDGDGNANSNILGYAVFPGDRNAATRDGIVMRADRVGTIGIANVGDRGRTLTHEVGHWLGLYHPFQGGCNGQGDRVSDTPPVKEASFGCPKSNNSCSTDSPDELDMVENFMDYANGSCMNAFTKGQKTRADGYLANLTTRGRNISAANIIATGVNTNPNCGPIADFWTENSRTVICEGGSISFEDLSYNGDVTSRTWTFSGGTPSVSTFENPSVVYNTVGVYQVELEVENSSGKNKVSKTAFITVLPKEANQIAPYGQDFTSSGSTVGWGLEKIQDFGWSRVTFVGYSGNQSLMCRISSGTQMGNRYSLELPPVDMSAHGTPVYLNFRHAYARSNSTASEVMLMMVSEDCGVTWKTFKGINANNGLATGPTSVGWTPSNVNDWGSNQVDLSAYANSKNLMIRMDIVSQSGNSVFIDDVNIGQFALSTPSYVNGVDLNIMPNPAQNQIEVNLDNKFSSFKVYIVDITGRLLLHQNLSQNYKTISTEDLPNGVYTVLVDSDKNRWSKKLVINK